MSRSNTKVRLVVLPTNFRCQESSFEQNGDSLDIGLGLTPVKILKIVRIKNKKPIIKSKIAHKILIMKNFLGHLLELPRKHLSCLFTHALS